MKPDKKKKEVLKNKIPVTIQKLGLFLSSIIESNNCLKYKMVTKL
jgi:hypothetical protein